MEYCVFIQNLAASSPSIELARATAERMANIDLTEGIVGALSPDLLPGGGGRTIQVIGVLGAGRGRGKGRFVAALTIQKEDVEKAIDSGAEE